MADWVPSQALIVMGDGAVPVEGILGARRESKLVSTWRTPLWPHVRWNWEYIERVQMPITIDDSNNIVVTPTLGGGTSASAWVQQLCAIEEEQLRRADAQIPRNFHDTSNEPILYLRGDVSASRLSLKTNRDKERKTAERTTKNEYTIK